MKRVIILFLLAALLLAGCAQEVPNTPYTVTASNGMEFTIDPTARTISDGKDTYSYYFDNNDITIYYPNGASFVFRDNMVGLGYEDYDPARYVDGMILVEALSAEGTRLQSNQTTEPKGPKKINIMAILAALIVVILGILGAADPETYWYLSRSWWYKDGSPSEAALKAIRIFGIIDVVFGILMIIGSVI